MKIGEIAIKAIHIGEVAAKALAIGATKVWEGVSKYIKFKDPAVEAICLAKWDTDGDGYLSKEEAKAVTSLGRVFQGNTDITSFDEFQYFTSVTSVGFQEFKGCSSLSSIKLPSSVTKLWGWSFESTALSSIEIGANITDVGEGCFAYTAELKTVIFKGEGRKNIGDYAFNTAAIDDVVLDSIPALFNIYPASTNATPFANNTKIHIGNEAITEINVPSNISTLQKYLLYKNQAIQTLNINEGCTSIGASFIFDNKSLRTVLFPSSLKSIEDSAFLGCENVAVWDLPASIESIGNSCFQWCKGMKYFVCRALTPPSLGGNMFSYSSSCPIYVPDASVEAYKAATNWSAYASRIKPLSEYQPTNE